MIVYVIVWYFHILLLHSSLFQATGPTNNYILYNYVILFASSFPQLSLDLY